MSAGNPLFWCLLFAMQLALVFLFLLPLQQTFPACCSAAAEVAISMECNLNNSFSLRYNSS